MRSLFRSLVLLGATDASRWVGTRSAVFLAPHPDDETLGCGATVLRKRDHGTPVALVVVTDGRYSHRSTAISPERLADLRRAELAEAATRLGLDDSSVHWLGLEDGTAAQYEDELVERVSALLRELRASECYATSAEEPHPDHAAVGRVARRAAAVVPGVTLLEYPVWLWDTWPLRSGDRMVSTLAALARILPGKAWKVTTHGYQERKQHALDAHASQLGRPDAVPATEDWECLPAEVLAAASGPHEVFFRTPPV